MPREAGFATPVLIGARAGGCLPLPASKLAPVTSPRRRPRCAPAPIVMRGNNRFGFVIPKKYLPPEFIETVEVPKASEKKRETLEPVNLDDAVDKVRKSIGSRVDLLIEGIGSEDRFAASMQAHQTRFNALILAPTRLQALAAVAELGEFSGRSRVIPIVGRGPHALQDPGRTAMGQANVGKGAVVVATPRALTGVFFKTGNGPKWLSLVERLILYDPQYMADIGGLNNLKTIIKFLPPTNRRQTVIIAPEHPGKNKYINTIVDGLLRPNTRRLIWPCNELLPEQHAGQVPQRYVVCKPDYALPALVECLNDVRSTEGYKAVVFFHTAKLAQFYAQIFRALGHVVEELHARRSSTSQMRALVAFAEEKVMTLFSSDMSAHRAQDMRVTHVICVGAPTDAEQYDRRVGVAAEAVGSSLLILEEHEVEVTKEVLGNIRFDSMTEAKCYAECDMKLATKVHDTMAEVPWQLYAHAFMSWLKHHSSRLKKFQWTREQLVSNGVKWALATTAQKPSPITKSCADKHRLWRIQGIVIDESEEYLKQLGAGKSAGEEPVDGSLDNLDPRLGIRGKGLKKRFIKKRVKIANWRAIAAKLKEEERKMLDSINRKSPEGRKYLALISQKAIQRSITPAPQEIKERKKRVKETPKPRRKTRIRLRPESWSNVGTRFPGRLSSEASIMD